MPGVRHLRLTDQAVQDLASSTRRQQLPGKQGLAAHVRGSAPRVARRRHPRAPQGTGPDPGPDGPAHAGIAWLPVANRAGQELGLDRDAVSHLAWSGGEDRRSVPGGADALVSFLSDQIPRETLLSGSGNSRFPARAALVFCSMSFAQVLGSRLFSAR